MSVECQNKDISNLRTQHGNEIVKVCVRSPLRMLEGCLTTKIPCRLSDNGWFRYLHLQLAVDMTHATEEVERCMKQNRNLARDVAHMQKAMPQAVKVLRDALKAGRPYCGTDTPSQTPLLLPPLCYIHPCSKGV